MDFRIIKPPTGEEPEHIRAAWVGLTLHCRYGGPRKILTEGLVTGESREQTVYITDAEGALAVLEEKDPQAAMWYREKSIIFNNTLGFNVEACERV